MDVKSAPLMVTMEKAYRAEDMKNNRNRAVKLLKLAKEQELAKGKIKYKKLNSIVPTWVQQ